MTAESFGVAQCLARVDALIALTLSDDNAVRDAAERELQTLRVHQPEQFVLSMAFVLADDSRPQTSREFSAVMARQCLIEPVFAKANRHTNGHTPDAAAAASSPTSAAARDAWPKLSPPVKSFVRSLLLARFEHETVVSLQHKVIDIIAVVSARCMDATNNEWPELMPTLMRAVGSPHPHHREPVLRCVEKLADTIDIAVLMPYMNEIKACLIHGLQSQASAIRQSSLRALISLLLAFDESDSAKMKDTIPLMFQSLQAAYTTQDEDVLIEGVEVLSSLVRSDPAFLRSHLAPIISMMTSMVSNNNGTGNLDDGGRRAAMEFLLSLAESGKGMIRKQAEFARTVIPLVFSLLLELEHSKEWETQRSNESDEFDGFENFKFGQEAIGRLAQALGGKIFITVAVPIINEFLNDRVHWQKRHAGFVAIARMTPEIQQSMEPLLGTLVQLILPYFNDSHVRVRAAAVECIAPLAATHAPEFQSSFHSTVVPALITVFNAASHPRVIAVASESLIEFCREINSEVMAQYAHQLLSALAQCMALPSLLIQESVISVVATLSIVIGDAFKPFYTSFYPGVKSIVCTAVHREQRALRGKAIECIGAIAEAVGPETFAPEARSIMEILVQIQREPFEDGDDPLPSFLVNCEARIAKCMKNDFLPYLPYVIPPLLQSASITDEFAVLDENDTNDIVNRPGYETTSLDIRGGGGVKITVNAAMFEEKAMACHMLYSYATELRGGFLPFVEQTATILIPLMSYRFHESVRVAACAACPALILSVKEGLAHSPTERDSLMTGLFASMFHSFIDVIKIEIHLDDLAGHLEALYQTIQSLTVRPSEQQMDTLCTTVHTIVSESVQRQEERETRRNDADFDEEESMRIEEENEDEEQMLGFVYSLIAATVRVSELELLPHYDRLLHPLLGKLLQSPNIKLVTLAICVESQLINDIPLPQPLKTQYCESLFASCIRHAASENNDLRQSACYGLGACAKNLGSVFALVVPQVLPVILQVIDAPDSRSEDNNPATDSAISTLDKILVHCASTPVVQSQCAELWQRWLACLPCSGDEAEAAIIHDVLIDRCEMNDVNVLGANGERIGPIIHIFANILESDYLTESSASRVQALMQQWRAQLDAQRFQLIIDGLDQEDRASIDKLLTT